MNGLCGIARLFVPGYGSYSSYGPRCYLFWLSLDRGVQQNYRQGTTTIELGVDRKPLVIHPWAVLAKKVYYPGCDTQPPPKVTTSGGV
jgi:hypothetical protein